MNNTELIAEARASIATSLATSYLLRLADALEAAQPAGEPVAYLETITGQVRLPDEDHRIRFPMAYKPLYTHPAPQVPMTDEEIDILYFPYSYLTLRKAFIAGIRIAEAHHKIGVKP